MSCPGSIYSVILCYNDRTVFIKVNNGEPQKQMKNYFIGACLVVTSWCVPAVALEWPAVGSLDSGPVSALVFSNDGQTLYAATSSAVKRWKLADGQALPELSGLNYVSIIVPSSDSKLLAAGSNANGGEIWVWDIESSQAKSKIQAVGAMTAIALAPDGLQLAASCSDKTIKIFELPSGKALKTITAAHYSLSAITYAKDGKHLKGYGAGIVGESRVTDRTINASKTGVLFDIKKWATTGEVTVWDLGKDEPGLTLVIGGGTPNAVFSSGPQDIVIAGSGYSRGAYQAYFGWEEKPRTIKVDGWHYGYYIRAVRTPNSTSEEAIGILDKPTGEDTGPSTGRIPIAVSQSGALVASPRGLSDLAGRKLLITPGIQNGGLPIDVFTSFAISPGEDILVGGSDQGIQVWRAQQ